MNITPYHPQVHNPTSKFDFNSEGKKPEASGTMSRPRLVHHLSIAVKTFNKMSVYRKEYTGLCYKTLQYQRPHDARDSVNILTVECDSSYGLGSDSSPDIAPRCPRLLPSNRPRRENEHTQPTPTSAGGKCNRTQQKIISTSQSTNPLSRPPAPCQLAEKRMHQPSDAN